MDEKDRFLLARSEGGKWVPVITLSCAEHGQKLERETSEMFGAVWKCPEAGCPVRVFVEVDRERLERIAADFNQPRGGKR